MSPFDQRVVDIRIIDSQGMNQSTAAERAIERNYFREDFRRAFLNEIGLIEYAHQPIAGLHRRLHAPRGRPACP